MVKADECISGHNNNDDDDDDSDHTDDVHSGKPQ